MPSAVWSPDVTVTSVFFGKPLARPRAPSSPVNKAGPRAAKRARPKPVADRIRKLSSGRSPIGAFNGSIRAFARDYGLSGAAKP